MTVSSGLCENRGMSRSLSIDDRAVLAGIDGGQDASLYVIRKLVLETLMTGDTLRSLHNRLQEANLDISYDRLVRAKAMIKKQWQEEHKKERQVYFNQELDRLQQTESVLWAEYHKAGGEYTREDVVEKFNQEGDIVSSSISKGRDSRLAMEWFDRILRLQAERRKLLGLDQTVNLKATINNNPLYVKGYVGLNPATDWPDPGDPVPDRKRTIEHYDD